MNGPPGNFNLEIYQGATYTQIFTWLSGVFRTGTAGATQQPVNLTGYIASMQIKAFALSTTVLYDASPNLTLGGASGTITLKIPATNTETFTWWSGVYDLTLTDVANNVTVLLSGTVTVTPGVTALLGIGAQIQTDAGNDLTTDGGNPINTSS